MATAHLPHDPTIAALADFCATLGEPRPIRSIDPRFFVASASLFWGMVSIVFGQYRPTLEQANGARALAYSEGVATAPKRPTSSDRVKANAAKWGFGQ